MQKRFVILFLAWQFTVPLALRAGDDPARIGVNVFGQVKRVDHFYLPQGSTVLDALACAGGLTDTGSLAKTRLIRRGAEGTVDIAIDLKAILAAKAPDVVLQNGDSLIVAERIYNVTP